MDNMSIAQSPMFQVVGFWGNVPQNITGMMCLSAEAEVPRKPDNILKGLKAHYKCSDAKKEDVFPFHCFFL